MKAIILKDEDGTELLKTLELEKFKTDLAGDNFTAAETHRRFHYHVVIWLQKHGFKLT